MGASDRFGTLPAYIRRDHDARLKSVVDEAKAGRSGIAVLVGGSSTGKTRALWEAVEKLPDDWRLWHPLSPTAPEAILDALADIAPKTVVPWLGTVPDAAPGRRRTVMSTGKWRHASVLAREHRANVSAAHTLLRALNQDLERPDDEDDSSLLVSDRCTPGGRWAGSLVTPKH